MMPGFPRTTAPRASQSTAKRAGTTLGGRLSQAADPTRNESTHLTHDASPMSNPPSPPIAESLAQRAREGATAEQMADLVVSAWQQIRAALGPVIGERGVAALYHRSLHLGSASHPGLAALRAGAASEINLESLQSLLAQQDSSQAAASGGALLMSFHALVGSLIGPALSGQLLGAVWVSILSGMPAQDPPP